MNVHLYILQVDVYKRQILDKSHKVETSNDIESVATISSGDKEIGQYIAQAMEKVGRDGVISRCV